MSWIETGLSRCSCGCELSVNEARCDPTADHAVRLSQNGDLKVGRHGP